MKILVRTPNWIGDAIMATPALHALRRARPDDTITVLCKSSTAPVFEHSPDIDECISLPGGSCNTLKNINLLAGKLSDKMFDAALVLPASYSSALIMKKSNIKQIVGHNKELRGGLLTDIVPWRQGKRGRARQHRTQTYLDIINQFTGNSDTDIQLHLYITDEEKQSIISRYADVFSQPVIGLNPNSQASSRRWPPEYFALLIDALADQGQKTVLFGGLDDIDRVQSIGDMCAHKPYNFAGKLSLREFFAAVSLCSLLVTNESGPMHIAAGVGIPIIVFLGAADEKETGPITDAPVIMLNHHLHCSPCVRNRCKRLWKKNKCLTDITPKETAKAIIDIASKQ